MPLEISHMTIDDAEEYGALDEASMEGWPMADAMTLEVGRRGQTRQEMAAGFVRKAMDSKDPNKIWLKVTDTETGEMAAGAFWRFHPENEVKDLPSDALVEAPAELEGNQEPKHDGPSLFAEMKANGNIFKEKFIGTKPHVFLHILVTHPKYQRRGAGGMLVKWGCDRADERGHMACLSSSEVGFKLYQKHGFKLVMENDLDLTPFGVEGTEHRRYLIRPAERTDA